MNWLLRKALGVRRRLVDAYWERKFDADTTGLRPGAAPDAHWYVTVPYSMIFRVLRELELGPQDVLIDLGSGKGRVLLCASRFPIAKAIGVELAEDMCEVARRNVARLKAPRCPVEVVNQNALEFDYRQGTAFYLFDPFGAETLRGVLQKMHESLAVAPRKIRLAFILAISPQSEQELGACGWLECYKRIEVYGFQAEISPVSFWRSRE
jgi:precorrin-6B methylase 2